MTILLSIVLTLGSVPQDDICGTEDPSVQQALYYTARMRLPGNYHIYRLKNA